MSTQHDTADTSAHGDGSGLTARDVLGRPADDRTGFPGYESYVEEARYWVYRPYSYISILYNEDDGNRVYYAVEPELDEYESLLKQELSDRLKDRLMFEDIQQLDGDGMFSEFEQQSDILIENALDVANDYGVGVSSESLHKVLYYVERDFIRYGRLEPVMQDPAIEDVSCNGHDRPLFVYHRDYEDLATNLEYEQTELNSFVIRLAQRAGKHISAADPVQDASLPDGSRAQLTLGSDVTAHGSTFTIRKFRDEPFTPLSLIEHGTYNVDQMSYLWLAIENDMSLIFAGGTGSGKTTSMNAVSLFIPPKQKIVSIEDTRELELPHENWVPTVTRESFGAGSPEDDENTDSSEVNMYNLLRAALRQRPEYLLVGEVRGREANTLFQAMSTGHTTYSTMHAENAKSVFKRLQNPPINVPDTLLESLDILAIQEETRVDGEKVRRTKEIAEVTGTDEQGDLQYEPYFSRDARTDEYTEPRGSSQVLTEIAHARGISQQELAEERDRRRRVLQYLLDSDIEGYKDVTRVLQAYMVDPDRIIDAIESDSLDPSRFEEMEAVV